MPDSRGARIEHSDAIVVKFRISTFISLALHYKQLPLRARLRRALDQPVLRSVRCYAPTASEHSIRQHWSAPRDQNEPVAARRRTTTYWSRLRPPWCVLRLLQRRAPRHRTDY